jgi:hypothetical protein
MRMLIVESRGEMAFRYFNRTRIARKRISGKSAKQLTH